MDNRVSCGGRIGRPARWPKHRLAEGQAVARQLAEECVHVQVDVAYGARRLASACAGS